MHKHPSSPTTGPQPSGLVKLVDLVIGLSRAMDLVSSAVANHHLRVGYVAARLAGALGLPAPDQRDLLLAGLLHDAGALSLKSRLDALQFEADGTLHAEAGYRLIRTFPRLAAVADLVRLHHARFDALPQDHPEVRPQANILNLADRVDALLRRDRPVLEQAGGVRQRIRSQSGSMFAPRYVQAFLDLSAEPGFWAGAQDPILHLRTQAPERLEAELLDLDEVRNFSRLFSQIIDYRSRFTATHSRGVARVAERLAQLAGFEDPAPQRMRVAGNLHDLGKLAVPREILDKPGSPDHTEWAVIKSHPGHSGQVLRDIPGLEDVCQWAGAHHERMDGKGYPDGLAGEDIPLGARVVATADIFTAITEDRPYRPGMGREQAIEVLRHCAGSALDPHLVTLTLDSFQDLDALRVESQTRAAEEFDRVYVPQGKQA